LIGFKKILIFFFQKVILLNSCVH